MNRISVMALFVGLSTALPIVSAEAETGRYTMTPTEDGALKLDTETGRVSLCRRSNERWSCKDVEDNSSDMQKRIDELERENAELRAKLQSRTDALPQPEGKIEIPSEEEVDKAMDFVERMLKRFRGMMDDMREKEKNEQGVPL